MSLTLPNELILMIIGHCQDLRTLKSVCLTSKMCLAAAQTLIIGLFEQLGHGHKFLRTLIQRPDLARQVRSTKIDLDKYGPGLDEPQTPLDAFTETLFTAAVNTLDAPQSFKDRLCALLTVRPDEAVGTLTVILCTHLETLCLTGVDHNMKQQSLTDFARLRQKGFLAHLRHFCAENWDHENYTGMEVLAPYFQAAPSLETFEGHMLRSSWGIHCSQLKTISLVNTGANFTAIRDMLASAPVLQDLDIDIGYWFFQNGSEFEWESLGNALRAHGTTLRSFQLSVSETDGHWRWEAETGETSIGDLTSLAHLSYLRLPAQAFSGIVDDEDLKPENEPLWPITALDADLLVNSLPHSLRRLLLADCSEGEEIKLSAAMDALSEERPKLRADLLFW